MSGSNFFDRLTEETMGLSSSDSSYDVSNIIKFFKDKSLLYYELRFNSKLAAYRAIIKNTVIDFPNNWGEFAKLSAEQCLIDLKDETFKKVMSESLFTNNLVHCLILVKAREHAYLVVCSENVKDLINDLEVLMKAKPKLAIAA